MEITIDIKAQIVYSYYGANYVYKNEFGTFGEKVNREDYHLNKNIANETFRLKLKPLSAITDKDAIEVAMILKPNDEHTHNPDYGKGYIKELFNGVMYTVDKSIKVYQFIKSKGYALPYMDYSVEDLVQAGIYKLV